MSGSLTQLLLEVQAPEADRRQQAEAQLTQAETSNFVEYCKALCAELADETKPETTRQVAGLMFKNAISGTEARIDREKRQRWISLEDGMQSELQSLMLKVLESSCSPARNSACQVIAKIARLELPQHGWPQLLPAIAELTLPHQPAHYKVAAYQVLGYVSEEIQTLSDELDRDVLSDEVKNLILSCLTRGLVESDMDVKLAALKGFYHGVLFAERFIQMESDRQQLYSVLGQCLTVSREDVELAAWEVFLQMANEFYTYLSDCMPALKEISFSRIQQSPQSNTALSAIEFWSTICDEEILILEEESTHPMKFYIRTYKDSLLPILFEATTKKDDQDTDIDEWNLSMAAGTSVALCAQVLKDDILPLALAFIESNFAATEWNRKDAAVLVYGSILEGPSTAAFGPLLERSFSPLCLALNDPSVAVRDTTAWTVGRIANFHLQAIAHHLGTSPNTPGLINLLVGKLTDEPRVAANVCFALYEVCAELENVTPRLSIDPFFTTIAEALVTVAKRPDASESMLRQAAYHALYMLVTRVGGGGMQEAAMKILLDQLLEWLGQTAAQPYSEEIASVQGPMCGCINALIVRLGPAVLPTADKIFQLCLSILTTKAPDGDWSSAAEEVLLTISALATAIGSAFLRYMNVFVPLLIETLQSSEDSQIASIAIDLVGSLASLGDEIAPHMPKLLDELFRILKNTNTPISLKPKSLNALSDYALLCPKHFKPHLSRFFDFLTQATAARSNQGPAESEDWVVYITELRDATLTGYSSAVCCIRELSAAPAFDRSSTEPQPSVLLENEAARILEFVYVVIGDVVSTNSNLKNAIILTEDLIPIFKGNLVRHLQGLPLYSLLKDRTNNSEDASLRQEGMKLEELMTKFRGSS